jgi:hypothetical protein
MRRQPTVALYHLVQRRPLIRPPKTSGITSNTSAPFRPAVILASSYPRNCPSALRHPIGQATPIIPSQENNALFFFSPSFFKYAAVLLTSRQECLSWSLCLVSTSRGWSSQYQYRYLRVCPHLWLCTITQERDS